MKQVIEAGTDVATLLLFDPGSLPEDFDARLRRMDYPAMLARLSEAGVACRIDTGADGAYLLHAYVDEPVPASLRPFLREPLTWESFAIPTGQLYFTGAECGFRDDDRQFRKCPHMGGHCSVTPGVYKLTVWRTEYPDEMTEQLLRPQVSSWAFRLHRDMGCLVCMAGVGWVGLAGSIVWANRWPWLLLLIPLWGVMILAPFVVARLPAFRDAQQRFRVIERELPSVVAHLETRGDRHIAGLAPTPP